MIIDPNLDLTPDEAAISQALRALESAIELETSNRITSDSGITFSINDIITGAQPVGTGQSVTETDDELISVIAGINSKDASQDTLISGNATAIEQEVNDRTDAIAIITPQISNISSQVLDLGNQLVNEITGRITSESSIATQISSINTSVTGIATDLATESSDRSSADSTFQDQLTLLQDNVSVAQAQIDRLSGIGVDPESALASQILDLSTRTDDVETAVADEAADRTSADTALNDDVTSLASTVSTLSDDLTAETTSRTAADVVLNSGLASLTTTVSGNIATITAETSARIAADNTINANLSSVQTQADNNSTLITAETAARTSADNTINTTLSATVSTVANHTTTISNLSFTVSNVIARYGLTISSGSVVGTIQLDGSNPASIFQVKSSKFQLEESTFTAIPFTVISAGTTSLSSCLISTGNTIGAAVIRTDANLRSADTTQNTQKFPPVSNIGVQLPASYSFEQGGVTSNTFIGLDTVTRTISHKVFTDISNLIFYGAYNTTISAVQNRLGGTGNTMFKIDLHGAVSRNISLWYRIKTLITDGGTWLPVVEGDSYVPTGARDYERISVSKNFVVAVDGSKLIEFGVAGVSIQNSQMVNTALDMCFSGSVTIQAYNWLGGVTI